MQDAQQQHDEAIELMRRQGREPELNVELLKSLTEKNDAVSPVAESSQGLGPIGQLMRKHGLTRSRAEELWVEFGG